MDRINDAMPQMCVPLLASMLLDAQGPVPREQLLADASDRVTAAPDRFLMRVGEAVAPRLERALDHMMKRGFVELNSDEIAIRAQERDTLQYYANSLGRPRSPLSAAAQ